MWHGILSNRRTLKVYLFMLTSVNILPYVITSCTSRKSCYNYWSFKVAQLKSFNNEKRLPCENFNNDELNK